MKFLKNAAQEILSLFVDDPLFALLVIVWAAATFLTRHMVPGRWQGPMLFAGFAVLLVGFSYRQAKVRAAKAV